MGNLHYLVLSPQVLADSTLHLIKQSLLSSHVSLLLYTLEIMFLNDEYQIWSEEDDELLWSLRSKKTTSQLAVTFNKTTGAIRSRLRHLNDPNHRAYQRRIQNCNDFTENY